MLVTVVQGNFAGAVLLSLCIFHAQSMPEHAIESAIAVAEKKTHLEFGVAVIRGILCNWLVCIAIWQVRTPSHHPRRVTADKVC